MDELLECRRVSSGLLRDASFDLAPGEITAVLGDADPGTEVLRRILEGTAKALMTMLKDELMSTTRAKLGAALSKPAFSSFKKKMDYTEVGGAPLMGISAPVIKAHGSSSGKAFFNAIRQAADYARSGMIGEIESTLAKKEA